MNDSLSPPDTSAMFIAIDSRRPMTEEGLSQLHFVSRARRHVQSGSSRSRVFKDYLISPEPVLLTVE